MLDELGKLPLMETLLDQLLAAHSRDEQVAITPRPRPHPAVAALQHPELVFEQSPDCLPQPVQLRQHPALHPRPAGLVAHSCGEHTMTPILRTLLASE